MTAGWTQTQWNGANVVWPDQSYFQRVRSPHRAAWLFSSIIVSLSSSQPFLFFCLEREKCPRGIRSRRRAAALGCPWLCVPPCFIARRFRILQEEAPWHFYRCWRTQLDYATVERIRQNKKKRGRKRVGYFRSKPLRVSICWRPNLGFEKSTQKRERARLRRVKTSCSTRMESPRCSLQMTLDRPSGVFFLFFFYWGFVCVILLVFNAVWTTSCVLTLIGLN